MTRARKDVVLSVGMGRLGGPPGMACLCQAVSMPSASRGVTDWRMEAMATPWMDSDVMSGFATFMLIDVEGSVMSWSSWKTPPGWVAEVFYVST